ncbi:MAG: Ig-like domain-containing protein [Candidatus Edwardsbacteria bacterium]|nr:Ig-like domain-containing protein [Candidatus Edwardsbacteria bacterium]
MKRYLVLSLLPVLLFWGCSKSNPATVSLDTAAAIAGRILPTGIGATVTATQGATVKTVNCDAGGNYRIDGLLVGSCVIEAKAPGFGTYRSTVSMTVGGSVFQIGDISLAKLPYPISSVSPAYNSEWNSLNTQVFIYFSRPMDKAATEAAFHITPAVSGYFRWTSNNSVLIFSPSPTFFMITDTVYTVTLDNTARTADNTALEFTMVFPFKTEPFRVTSVSPNYGTTGFWLQSNATIYFTTYSQPNTPVAEGAVQITPAVPGGMDYTWYGYYVQLRPKIQYWRSNTQYTIMVPTTVTDAWNHRVFMPCTTVFYTQPARVQSYQPANGQTGVSLNPYLYFYFNTMMDYATVSSALTVKDTLDSIATIGSSNWYGHYGYFYFNPQLKPQMRYTVRLDTTAADAYGSKMPLPLTFSFTTGN